MMIDKLAYVQCPMQSFDFTKALDCETCEHFKGLKPISTDASKLWSQRFFITCAYPMTRRTRMVFDDEAMAIMTNEIKRRINQDQEKEVHQ